MSDTLTSIGSAGDFEPFEAGLARLLRGAGLGLGLATRGWLAWEQGRFLVRVGERMVGHEHVSCIIISNVVMSEAHQGRGSFARLLLRIASLTQMPVYLEGVTSERFAQGLRRRGFRECRVDGRTVDFIRPG